MGNAPDPEKAAKLERLQENWDENCKEAADVISTADYFLLAAGAGFSADSGLKVYKDIGEHEVYAKQGLIYEDLSRPGALDEDPELFFGFWGMCFNDYRKANPHEGYEIIKNWKKNFPTGEKWTDCLRSNCKILEKIKNLSEEEMKCTIYKPEDVENLPGPFFIFTSNVDGHFGKAGFKKTEIYELHGTTERWQCSDHCCNYIWSAPEKHNFEIDFSTMRCKQNEISKPNENGFGDSWPVCIKCGKLARPCVLMFSDRLWVKDELQSSWYFSWHDTVHNFLRDDKEKKLVVLEIGCGENVPSVRMETESYLKKKDTGGQVCLIRINPDDPFVTGEHNGKVISICGGGLKSLKKIDEYLKETEEQKQSS